MTDLGQREIVGEDRWRDGQEVTDLDELLGAFECTDVGDLEDQLHGDLPEDPGTVTITDDGGSISINSYCVSMWALSYPFSARQFDRYLFELDERTTLQKALFEIPTPWEWTDRGQPDIVPELAALFGVTKEEFQASLGSDWRPLDLDWPGSSSVPSVFLWSGDAVVGLDNSSAYLYRPAAASSLHGLELDGEAYEEVGWATDIWDGGGPGLDWFVPFVQSGDSPG